MLSKFMFLQFTSSIPACLQYTRVYTPCSTESFVWLDHAIGDGGLGHALPVEGKLVGARMFWEYEYVFEFVH